MKRIILFKSESDGPDKFVEELEKNNFSVRSIPSIDFNFKNLNILKEKLKNYDKYEGIIWTSPRSVIATQHSIDNEPDEQIMKFWSDKRNYSVGLTTFELAKNLLNIDTNGKDAGNAAKLSTIIINDNIEKVISKPFLFPSGNLKQDILEKNLSAQSIMLEAVEVYETVSHPNLENAIKEMKKEYDISYIVFFSPSGLKYSLPFITKHLIDITRMNLIAIGPSTKRCFDEYNLNCFDMCEKPTPESLLNVLLK